MTGNSGTYATLVFRSFQTPKHAILASDLYEVAPSLTLDLNNDGITCNSGTIITPSYLPPPFRFVCYDTIANSIHLSHSRSKHELIDTKPNWVKGDTCVIMVVKLGVMWLLEGERERYEAGSGGGGGVVVGNGGVGDGG
ncbi:hypothetical protein Hanom_Chr12g01088871 [Helianthus anomalus]